MRESMILAALILSSTPAFAVSSWRQLEDRAQRLESQTLSDLADALQRRDAKAGSGLFVPDAVSFAWNAPRAPRRAAGGIQESDWSAARPLSSRAAVQRDLSDYLASFTSVESASLEVRDVSAAEGESVAARLYLDLRGRARDGARRHDRGEMDAVFVPQGESWAVARLSPVRLETLTSRAVSFEERTEAAGLTLAPSTRQEAIRRGGYALAVADYDGDGFADILAGDSGRMHLWRNRGDGTYADATASSGLPGDDMVKAALIADMDNDGRADLVLQRFVYDEAKELLFYRNIGQGRFAAAKARVSRARKHDRPMSMAAIDVNNDGLLDLYIGYPGTMDFTDPRLSSPDKLAHQAIYLNGGDWKFSEVDDKSAPLSQLVRPHAAMGTDIDGDGRFDILVVDDRGEASRIYLSKGSGRLEPAETKLGVRNRGWGMVAAAGDYLADGRLSIYFTNIDFRAGRRVLSLIERYGSAEDKANPRLSALREIMGGNRLFRPSATAPGTYEEVSKQAGIDWAGEGPAGAAWIDYDSDGYPDLYVMNGLWSGDPRRDQASRFVTDLVDGLSRVAGPVNEVMHRLQKTGDSFGGHQRNRLFRNNHDGTFTEIGYLAGADRPEDGYVPAVADIDGDGRPDLVMRNADPASTERSYAPVTVLRNIHPSAGRSLAVRLRGSDGLSAAFGARVTAYIGGRVVVQEVRSIEGAVQGEPVAFFGLGSAEKVDRLEIRWPSSRVDVFRDLRPGRIQLSEGDGAPNYLTQAAAVPTTGL